MAKEATISAEERRRRHEALEGAIAASRRQGQVADPEDARLLRAYADGEIEYAAIEPLLIARHGGR